MKPICNADRCLPKPVSVPEVFGKRLLTLRAKLDLLGVVLGQAVGVGPSTGWVGAAWEAEHQSRGAQRLLQGASLESFAIRWFVRDRAGITSIRKDATVCPDSSHAENIAAFIGIEIHRCDPKISPP